MNVRIHLPDDLAETVKAQTDLDVSAVCEEALRRELSRRATLATLDKDMERHVFRVSRKNSSIPGMDLRDETSREVAFIGKEIASLTWATTQPWIAYLTRKHQIALWDDDGGLMVFSSFAELKSSAWSDSRQGVVAQVAKALREDYVTELDI